MAQKDRTTLNILSTQVRDETSEKANTATRLGQLFIDFLDSLRHKDDAISFPASGFSLSGSAYGQSEIGTEVICLLTTPGGSYTLPALSGLTNKSFVLHLKNDSGGNVTITPSGSDTVDGDTSVVLSDTESLTLYLGTSEYKVL